jgi:hypothetical protein
MKLERQKSPYFQEKQVPPQTTLAGTAALVQSLNVQAPVRNPSCVADHYVKGSIRQEREWRIFDKRYLPENTFEAHLTFSLTHEYLNLLVLKRIFLALPESHLAKYVQSAPTGIANRRAWFLYEFLTGKKLKIADAPKVTTIDVLDAKKYFAAAGLVSKRHKVRNNLLGNSLFCPIIRRSEKLTHYVDQEYAIKAQQIIGKISSRTVARAASFLLLADSRASFEIEGERPARNRLERWGRAIQQAGRHDLTSAEIIRLHKVLIEDSKFTQTNFRKEGVFIGERATDGEPLPEFIGARPNDLEELMSALIDANHLMNTSQLDAVLQAAAIAFGFVYIHPFEDGNGRLHRYLIHHVLTQRNYSPPGLVFPVSSVMLDWINEYRNVLQNHSAPLMPFIEWQPTTKGNVEVTNDTADLYRYFDCTEACEFLYRCVERTINSDLPHEIEYLKRHDQAMQGIMNEVEMPDRKAEDLIMFMRQNNWKLPKTRREGEFAMLTDTEAALLEKLVQEAFAGFEK